MCTDTFHVQFRSVNGTHTCDKRSIGSQFSCMGQWGWMGIVDPPPLPQPKKEKKCSQIRICRDRFASLIKKKSKYLCSAMPNTPNQLCRPKTGQIKLECFWKVKNSRRFIWPSIDVTTLHGSVVLLVILLRYERLAKYPHVVTYFDFFNDQSCYTRQLNVMGTSGMNKNYVRLSVPAHFKIYDKLHW